MGKVYPGIGKTEIRDWTDAEKSALCKGFADEGIDEVRRLAAIILLGDALDANYVACRDNAYGWPGE